MEYLGGNRRSGYSNGYVTAVTQQGALRCGEVAADDANGPEVTALTVTYSSTLQGAVCCGEVAHGGVPRLPAGLQQTDR